MGNKQEIILIAAMADNRVIGKDNKMPWNIKGNLKHFKEMTMGYPCIMGRKTWDSLPKKPLHGRLNIIISKTLNQKDITQRHKGTEDFISLSSSVSSVDSVSLCELFVFKSLTEALKHCSNYEKIFIIGGESIYKQSIQLANKIDLTLIQGQYEGDTFFPEIDDSWIKTNTVNHDDFSVITYIRKEKK